MMVKEVIALMFSSFLLLLIPCCGYYYPKHKDPKIFANHLNPVMFVFFR